MGQSECPEFRSGPEDVDEAFAIARADFGAIGYADEI